jgi:hypothetical protein
MRLIVGINGKYPQVNSELHVLQTEEIITDKQIGRMRIISLNKENPKTGVLLQALKLLHSTDDKRFST